MIKEHYSQKYCIRELIDQYCTEEWKFMVKENEEVLHYEAGVRIFKEGEKAKRIKILKKGKVKVHCKIDDESEQILRLVSDRQIIGHRAFGGNFKYSVSATTLTECEIVYIPIKLFLSLLKANSEFCFHFMMFFAEELKNMEQHMRLNKAKNLRSRIAAALVDNIIAFGYHPQNEILLNHTITRKEFSSLSNTTYESVVRTFKKFADEGLIRLKGKNIEILNEEKLIEISTLNYI